MWTDSLRKRAGTVYRPRNVNEHASKGLSLDSGEPLSEFRAKDGRTVVLRVLRRNDIEALLRFANAIVKERATNHDIGIVSLDKRVTRAEERKFLNRIVSGMRKKEVVSIAAFAGNDMVGHCDIQRRKLRDIRHTGVLGIVIRKEYRGIGLGGRMIAEALRAARRMGVWLVELTVFATNATAMHLYERMGFVKVGVVPNKILRDGRHYDEVVMYTDLRGSDKSLLGRRRES